MSIHSKKKEGKDDLSFSRGIIKLAITAVFIMAIFVAGFFVRGNQAILDRIGFGDLSSKIEQNPGMTVLGDTRSSLSARIAEVQGVLEQQGNVEYDLDVATAETIQGLISATGDPYMKYFDVAAYDKFTAEVAENFAGVGVLFGDKNSMPYALDVFPLSSAEAEGVLEGDFVVSVDGEIAKNWTQEEVINSISKHQEGEQVVITWERPTVGDTPGFEFTTSLTVQDFEEVNLTTEIIGQVGYIKLKQLTADSTELVSNAIAELESAGVLSYVLDLRGNPGGFLSQAIGVSSLFLEGGAVVGIETSSGVSLKNATGGIATSKPLVVLMDKDTAAGAEIICGAIKDADRGTLIGENTMGKGTVQRIHELSFGGAIRYTVAYYHTPSGYTINNAGITPDLFAPAQNTDEDVPKVLALDTAADLAADVEAPLIEEVVAE